MSQLTLLWCNRKLWSITFNISDCYELYGFWISYKIKTPTTGTTLTTLFLSAFITKILKYKASKKFKQGNRDWNKKYSNYSPLMQHCKLHVFAQVQDCNYLHTNETDSTRFNPYSIAMYLWAIHQAAKICRN